jgi:hypothetical protein
MQLTYLGPMREALPHPLGDEIDPEHFPPSCYLVEVSAKAGVEGPIIEGDVLVVDEARPMQHADLVVVETGEGLVLFRSHRIGGRFRLVPAGGGQGHKARPELCRGVVVRQARVWAA